MDILHIVAGALFVVGAQSFVEVPKFSQLTLLYPGYHLHGGQYRDRDVIVMVGGNHTNPIRYMHNTAPLRMSVTLNKYGGRHSIGTEPILLSKKGLDSVEGGNGQQYIFRNTAFGPFLASKYGNPLVVKPNKHDHSLTMVPFRGKRGIARLVSYHRDHAGGHVALWDCDHFHQSRDWTEEHHLISVEFWETPDSFCPPESTPPEPHLQKLSQAEIDSLHVISRHNFVGDETPSRGRHHQGNHETHSQQGAPPSDGTTKHHRHSRRRNERIVPAKETLWLQK